MRLKKASNLPAILVCLSYDVTCALGCYALWSSFWWLDPEIVSSLLRGLPLQCGCTYPKRKTFVTGYYLCWRLLKVYFFILYLYKFCLFKNFYFIIVNRFINNIFYRQFIVSLRLLFIIFNHCLWKAPMGRWQ